jgi:cytochrome c553
MLQTICAACHGFDGRAMNFRDDAHPQSAPGFSHRLEKHSDFHETKIPSC